MITFRRLKPEARIPVVGTTGAACLDAEACLREGDVITYFNSHNEEGRIKLSSNQMNLIPGSRYLVPLGWAVKMSAGISMRIYSRSGLALKQGLVIANGEGIVDSDYRHEVFAILTNISARWVTISNGNRICQLEFVQPSVVLNDMPIIECEDEEWFNTDRKGGFGSTGILTTHKNGDILH
jgi:dUTP pyrophosphatase